jgi:pantoate--beta-alanine ligase
MRTLRGIDELRTALAPARGAGRTIGLVPTMGALHEGHLSLIHRARADCDEVVVSLFVNPTQFNERSDLVRYPRDEARDAALASEAGTDLLFAPAGEAMYPPAFATTVHVAGVTETLEGAARGRAHFDGVATVVSKLLNIVTPDVAYFGQKDAQQTVVIRRVVRDLDLPVRIEVCPTVREPDGLAMSSRNALLGAEDRARAVALSRALAAAQERALAGGRDAASIVAAARAAMAPFAVAPEYLALVDPDTFAPVAGLERPALLAVAARVGPARLIDNAILKPRWSGGALSRPSGVSPGSLVELKHSSPETEQPCSA